MTGLDTALDQLGNPALLVIQRTDMAGFGGQAGNGALGQRSAPAN